MFIAHCNNTDSITINTFFEKPDEQLRTYKVNKNNLGPPYNRTKYETLDYILVPNRWKNTFKNVEADPNTYVDSDHFCLLADIQIKLKANHSQQKIQRPKYEQCTEEKRYDFNRKLKENYEGDWKQWLQTKGE